MRHSVRLVVLVQQILSEESEAISVEFVLKGVTYDSNCSFLVHGSIWPQQRIPIELPHSSGGPLDAQSNYLRRGLREGHAFSK